MKRLHSDHFIFISLLFAIVCLPLAVNRSVEASCGAASCFLAVGNQPAVQPKDLVRVDLSYSYVPQTGPDNRVAAVIPDQDRQVLSEHQEFQTITQQLQLDMNYGVTDEFTLHLTLPVILRDHDHNIEVGEKPTTGANIGAGEFENFDASGLGDIRLMGKYGFLPSLRSLVVLGAGVVFPTGDFESRNIEGKIQEPTLQVGRGDYGVIGQIYQAYELIPHKLNQFFSYTYEHTFENKFDYQFGDTHIIAGGLNYQLTPKITLSGQLNWRYRVHDECRCNLEQARFVGPPDDPIVIDPIVKDRPVTNTGSTALMFTPGFLLHLGESTNFYFYSQVPLARDFNDGLEQGVSFLTGFSKSFTLGGEG